MSDTDSWMEMFRELGVEVTVATMDYKPIKAEPCFYCNDTGWVDVGGGMASIGCPIHNGQEVKERE
jgi:hypothetical protein